MNQALEDDDGVQVRGEEEEGGVMVSRGYSDCDTPSPLLGLCEASSRDLLDVIGMLRHSLVFAPG